MLFCLSHLAPAPVCVHHAPFQAKTYPTTGAKTCVYVCTVIPIYIYRQPGRGRDAIHGSVDAKKHQEISRGPWRVSILRRFKPCIQHSPTPIGLYHFPSRVEYGALYVIFSFAFISAPLKLRNAPKDQRQDLVHGFSYTACGDRR